MVYNTTAEINYELLDEFTPLAGRKEILFAQFNLRLGSLNQQHPTQKHECLDLYRVPRNQIQYGCQRKYSINNSFQIEPFEKGKGNVTCCVAIFEEKQATCK